jgi:hypothetical protein
MVLAPSHNLAQYRARHEERVTDEFINVHCPLLTSTMEDSLTSSRYFYTACLQVLRFPIPRLTYYIGCVSIWKFYLLQGSNQLS